MAQLSPREKWFLFLKGEDVGPMVSPLCDDWALDRPYYWPYDDPDPFPAQSSLRTLSEQMAMAKICGWDPTFYAAVPFQPRNPDITPQTRSRLSEHGTLVESRIRTPYGDLTCAEEHADTIHVIEPWLKDEHDFRKAIWLTRQQMDYDEDGAIEVGRRIREAVGDRGVVGTWLDAPLVNLCGRDRVYYLKADWPQAFDELHAVTAEMAFKRVATFRKAGFDYLFYCVEGTELTSPGFFRAYMVENTRRIFGYWRGEGGFILWHTCGHVRFLIDEGFYNDLKPEIFETLSEPPVGNLPSLRWARERLDPVIATKGNIGLDVMLNGTEEHVRSAVHRVREQTRGTRHIVGLTDDLLHHTPLANCLALVAAAREA